MFHVEHREYGRWNTEEQTGSKSAPLMLAGIAIRKTI
jgi:hypothetical protein